MSQEDEDNFPDTALFPWGECECGEPRTVDSDDTIINCNSCREDGFFRCESCCETFNRDGLFGSGYCISIENGVEVYRCHECQRKKYAAIRREER